MLLWVINFINNNKLESIIFSLKFNLKEYFYKTVESLFYKNIFSRKKKKTLLIYVFD